MTPEKIVAELYEAICNYESPLVPADEGDEARALVDAAPAKIQGLVDAAREEGRKEAFLAVERLCVERTNIDPRKEPDDVSLAMTELKCRVQFMRKAPKKRKPR